MIRLSLSTSFLILLLTSASAQGDELARTKSWCDLIRGETEVRHTYTVAGQTHHIRVDCETQDIVVEAGMDNTRASLDSLHQATFAAIITGKAPVVLIHDTDGKRGQWEHQIYQACKRLDVSYIGQ